MNRFAPSTSVVILAAGSGSRMAAGKNKVFLDLGGVTILEHSLSLFATLPFVHEIVLVFAAGDRAQIEGRFARRLDDLGVTRCVPGGQRRVDSSRAGVGACSRETKLILIHDAARPFAPAEGVEAAVRAAAETGAAILALPLEDTLKKSTDGRHIETTLARGSLYRAQTPQVFENALIRRLLDEAGDQDFTDDAALAEKSGKSVALVAGSEQNIKITTPGHLDLARAIYRVEKE